MSELYISIGVALALRDIADEILYKKEIINNKLVKTERELPFRLKYRIGRNLAAIDRDVKMYNQNRLAFLMKFGTRVGDNIEIEGEENQEKFQQCMQALLEYTTPHTIVRIDPEDIDQITENIDISYEDLKIFIGFMCEEQELFESLALGLEFDTEEAIKNAEENKDTENDTNETSEEKV